MPLPAVQFHVYDVSESEETPRARSLVWFLLYLFLTALSVVAGGHIGPFHHHRWLDMAIIAVCISTGWAAHEVHGRRRNNI